MQRGRGSVRKMSCRRQRQNFEFHKRIVRSVGRGAVERHRDKANRGSGCGSKIRMIVWPRFRGEITGGRDGRNKLSPGVFMREAGGGFPF